MLKNLLATFLRFACYDFKKSLLILTDLFTLKASSVKLVFYFIFLFYPFTQLSEELFYSIFSHDVSVFRTATTIVAKLDCPVSRPSFSS